MSRLDSLMREVTSVLVTEGSPPAELAPAAIELAAEALRVAVEALPEKSPREAEVVLPLAPQDVLATAERTGTALRQLMLLLPLVEHQLYDVDDDVLYAGPTRPEESGQKRGSRLMRAAGAALHGIEAEFMDGSSHLLIDQIYRLADVEIRKPGELKCRRNR